MRLKGYIVSAAGELQPYSRVNVYDASNGADVVSFASGGSSTKISASTGGVSTELAGGVTLKLSPKVSVYGEVGKLWAINGDTKFSNSLNGSAGVRVLW